MNRPQCLVLNFGAILKFKSRFRKNMFTILNEFIYNYSNSSIRPLCNSTYRKLVLAYFALFLNLTPSSNISCLQVHIIKSILHESRGCGDWPLHAAVWSSLCWLIRFLLLS